MTIYKKMDQAIKAKWIAALRSGQYDQTQGRLRSPLTDEYNKFCCLGVACDVYDSGGWKKLEQIGKNPPVWNHVATDRSYSQASLSYHMMAVLGICSSTQAHLINMNDKEGKTFAEIADWIEANL